MRDVLDRRRDWRASSQRRSCCRSSCRTSSCSATAASCDRWTTRAGIRRRGRVTSRRRRMRIGRCLPSRANWDGGSARSCFPGVLAIVLGASGWRMCWKREPDDASARDDRETVMLYGSLGVLAFWASFGPAAGLYTVLYRACRSSRSCGRRRASGCSRFRARDLFASLALRRLLPPRTGASPSLAVASLAARSRSPN